MSKYIGLIFASYVSQIGTWSDVRAMSGERNGLKITRNPLVGAGYLPKQTGKSE